MQIYKKCGIRLHVLMLVLGERMNNNLCLLVINLQRRRAITLKLPCNMTSLLLKIVFAIFRKPSSLFLEHDTDKIASHADMSI